MREVRFNARARADIERLDAWWQMNRRDAPLLFRTELEAALHVLSEQPEAAPVFVVKGARAVRRWILGESRAHVYYVALTERVVVLRLWGAVRGRPPSLR